MDIALRQTAHGMDIAIEGGDLAVERGLHTAAVLSLLLDRRAEPGDELPDGSADRRGWWADGVGANDGDRIGSRAWLLHREKDMARVRQRAEEYDREALAWMVDDGVADRVEVDAETVSRGLLGRIVRIDRPDGTRQESRFNVFWEAV